MTTLRRQLQRQPPALIVLEATGGLARLVASTLAAAGLPVAVVNPRQVRDFAKAPGQLANSAALDAQVLAHFAAVVQPAPQASPLWRAQEDLLQRVPGVGKLLMMLNAMLRDRRRGGLGPSPRLDRQHSCSPV